MLPENAINELSNCLNDTVPQELILQYEEQKYRINLQELEVQFDIEGAIQKAYSIGRTQNVVKDLWEYAKTLNDTVNIEPNLLYEEEILNEMLRNLQEQLPKVQEYDYFIENDELLINRGKSGVGLHLEELKNKILENLRDRMRKFKFQPMRFYQKRLIYRQYIVKFIKSQEMHM